MSFSQNFTGTPKTTALFIGYIKPASPNLNAKVERSHLTDKQAFYQLLNYTGDRDLTRLLAEWEGFYNYHRPHTALNGKTPYEILKKSWPRNGDLCQVRFRGTQLIYQRFCFHELGSSKPVRIYLINPMSIPRAP